jgi:sarcosine oxidase subunit alpha
MFRRTRAPSDPVTVYLDGEAIPAERGEPIAAALLASDKTILARSPKLHRPRGPSCFRGGCDGCLARVDGVPNVMTCLARALGGERVDSQNVVGSRKADLLRVTDWFFAHGLDHHHLMAGVPGLSSVMQGVATKVAGLGRLPGGATPPRPARRVEADVVVIGGGVTGISVASRLAREGLRAVLVDDGLALGGAIACSEGGAARVLARAPLDGVEVLERSVAAGVYDGEVLIASTEAVLVRPRAIVFASGAHDGQLAVPGNDLPGIFSARALCRLVHAGITPDGPAVVVGAGFWADELERALVAADAVAPPVRSLRVAPEDLVDVRGTGGVRAVTVRDGTAGLLTREAAVVALALPGAPAFELAAQAGAATRFDPALGYVVQTGERGRVLLHGAGGPTAGPRLWAAGECAGRPFDPEALHAEGEAVAVDVARALAPV